MKSIVICGLLLASQGYARTIIQWKDGHVSVASVEKEFLASHAGKIKYFEEDRYIKLLPSMLKNQPASDLNWGQVKVEVSQLWNQGIKGAGVLIGVPDSGIHLQHSQLRSRIAVNSAEAAGRPGIDDDQNGYIDDINGWSFVAANGQMSDHGTHVAGTLVADHSTGDVQGMAPEAQIIPVSFIDSENGGSVGDAVLSVQYAISRGARIINVSWGGAPFLQSLYDVIHDHPDVLFIVAAGNEGNDLDYTPNYPAAFNLPNQLTVAASTNYDSLAYWSNTGFQSVHVAAPGVDILSTGANRAEIFMSGTSVATPFVTGAAALLWSYNPTATVAQIRQALIEGVDVGPYPLKVQSQGRLNVLKAFASLNAMSK